jgi:aspartyl-tRNA(Asn)/glutamyl-tRNA(Gln) amidotransferase subunit A
MPSTDDLCYLSAVDLAARISARKVSPVEVIDTFAERIKRLNPKLNAYFTLDLANARKDAEMKPNDPPPAKPVPDTPTPPQTGDLPAAGPAVA